MDSMPILIQIPHLLHLEGKLFESCGCLVLVCRDDIGSRECTIYEMMKRCYVWSVRYRVDTDDFMTSLPEGWSIRSTVWHIVIKGRGFFVGDQLLWKVIKESLVKTKQKGAILELKRRHLKKNVNCYNTSYPAKKIQCISASSSQETRNDQFLIRRITLHQYTVKKKIIMAGPIMKEYISATSKSFVSNDNNGKMIEKNFIEIEGTFLLKIRDNAFYNNDGEDVFKHINSAASEWFTKECIGTISTWDDLVERFVLKFYNLCEHDEEEETEDEDDPDVIDNISEIFKIDDDLFKFDSPLCIPFEEFNHLLKIDPDLFTYNTQKIKTYDEYEQELNNKTQGLEEPWSKNEVSYQLYDHICEPYRFKNGKTKWPACNSDIDGFYNSGELPGMVRVGNMTYFQDHKWYDELADEKLKRETLALKAKIEGTWGEATPSVMKFCIWLKNSFENFHELDYNILVKLQ
ncbi:hypothetical protein Tco_1042282 [Tanacetum coccineum]|uniref:Uncharacterized protein n=1 Tax=Tanacetum coccineum TaxID=301880 RepID=A0ABQ5GIM4_9ASTR